MIKCPIHQLISRSDHPWHHSIHSRRQGTAQTRHETLTIQHILLFWTCPYEWRRRFLHVHIFLPMISGRPLTLSSNRHGII